MRILKPKALHAGDTIGLVAPAFAISQGMVARGSRFLERLGYKVKLGKQVFAREGFLAGSDAARAADIHTMFEDAAVDAIFCVRGGTGCNRLLPLLDMRVLRKHPKIFMGMSDISILLNVFFAKAGLVTFHGPNVDWLRQDPHAGERLQLLAGGSERVRIAPLSAWRVLRAGVAEGSLLVGNLEALDALAGSPFALDWRKTLFFWEELREDASELSHFLMNYKLRGVFDEIRGMGVGKLYHCPPKEGVSVEKVVSGLTREYPFPIMTQLDFGHYCKSVILPVGVRARMDAGKKRVELLESPVKE